MTPNMTTRRNERPGMHVLVDTAVWSLALRRKPAEAHAAVVNPQETAAIAALRDLVADGRATMIGPVRQELLSGIKSDKQFQTLRDVLQGFEDIPLEKADYELAAEFFNTCRARGVQGSNTDFLICAVASARKIPILSTDKDFALYRDYLAIQLLPFQQVQG